MNQPVTSREEILHTCRQLVMEKGMPAVNMRSVASACGVALGSLYNYFGGKAELISATVESVWADIFQEPEQRGKERPFLQAVLWMHDSLQQAKATYPGFFTLHAMSFAGQDRQDGRRVMQAHFERIRQLLQDALLTDQQVSPTAFDARCTREGVVRLAFDTVIATAINGQNEIDALLCLLDRGLYRKAEHS